METTTNVARSVAHFTSAQPLAQSVERLTDAELLAGTCRLVGRSNQLLAELFAHLGEVEARGIHRARACSSLYTYSIYELRFSEDEAFRRVAAARHARRFPVLLEAVSAGELHLTGLLMLGPHLTESNLTEVLARAKHRTKRELARLVRELDPLPAVPARSEPLGPAPARLVPETPTWEAFVQSMCPVRELTPGDRPRDWVKSANDAASAPTDDRDPMRARAAGVAPTEHGDARAHGDVLGEGGQAWSTSGPEVPAPARMNAVAPDSLAPERYKVQFTATDEYVRLVEEAKALLSHAVPQATLEEIHLRAMRALVSELTKKKYAARNNVVPQANPREAGVDSAAPHQAGVDSVNPHQARSELPYPHEESADSAKAHGARSVPHHPRRRGRHIPAAVRRAVYERDGSRCTYVAATGERCTETHRLEFHHLTPFAVGGEHDPSNLTLRCAAHNALAAEEDFGRELVAERRGSSGHDPWCNQAPSLAWSR